MRDPKTHAKVLSLRRRAVVQAFAEAERQGDYHRVLRLSGLLILLNRVSGRNHRETRRFYDHTTRGRSHTEELPDTKERAMSEWTYERHDDARWVAENGGDDLAPYLNAALDEIERMRALQEDPDAIERAAQGMMQACQDSLGEDIDWDADQIAWFERDARAALRAALSPKEGEQA